MIRNLEKYEKYKKQYKPHDTFWGLGLEHETYLETNKLKQITTKELKENKEPERYSVRSYEVYSSAEWERAIDDLFPPETQSKLLLPILVNSHTFLKTDLYGEHPTLLERIPKPNPKFQGITLFEWMKQQNPDVFQEEYDQTYTFDGDQIQCMTQHFYKATISSVLHELLFIEKEIIRALNSLPREGVLKTYGPFQLLRQSYPFASYVTNLKHNAMCHHGSIQIHITLPTKLNEKGEVENVKKFVEEHQNYARLIQWIEPLLVGVYGAPDPLVESKQWGSGYAAGSQRIAISRYVGLGTYDTDKMEEGMMLNKRTDQLHDIDWYESFYEKTEYECVKELGMDLNFHKYDGHGLEIRILDDVPLSSLESILSLLIHLADVSLFKSIKNAKKSQIWHTIAERCVHLGKGYQMDVSDQYELFHLLEIPYISKEPLGIEEVLQIIQRELSKRWEKGPCTQRFINGEIPPIEPKIESKIEPKMESTVELEHTIPSSVPEEDPESLSKRSPMEIDSTLLHSPKNRFCCC